MPAKPTKRPVRAHRTGAAADPSQPDDDRRPRDAAAPGSLTVDELAESTGVTVRNIRAYQTAGLLQPPTLQGRLALYSRNHLSRLELIRELRAMGFGLDAIGDMLAKVPRSAGSPYALIAQMFSRGFFQVEQPERKTLADLAAHWNEKATPQQVQQLIRNGLYQPLPSTDPNTPPELTEVEVLSPTLWAIGKQMAELDIPLPTVLDMQEKLIEHCRALAKAYVDQFVIAMVREVTLAQASSTEPLSDDETALSPTLLRTIHHLIDRLRPIAIGSVSAAFPVVLQQEFDRDVVDRIQDLAKQPKSDPGQP